ncbi:putative mitochondrial F1F0 ATP synthase subunit Atp18 [Teratosphaeria destructans]|uniref:Mitochondrial F1F0 ATP synthase subunit Atp18 n=1 Tax=Teratosphaeria destructans TaxID=418781 RepID=A0A9W7SQH4_9PEZI|nr:putative mitochondrial F1F0 ATP synthase subunit Atp18 [Teratosphaeria destructans]
MIISHVYYCRTVSRASRRSGRASVRVRLHPRSRSFKVLQDEDQIHSAHLSPAPTPIWTFETTQTSTTDTMANGQTYSLLPKKFPVPIHRTMWPFYVAGLTVAYGINSLSTTLSQIQERPAEPGAQVGQACSLDGGGGVHVAAVVSLRHEQMVWKHGGKHGGFTRGSRGGQRAVHIVDVRHNHGSAPSDPAPSPLKCSTKCVRRRSQHLQSATLPIKASGRTRAKRSLNSILRVRAARHQAKTNDGLSIFTRSKLQAASPRIITADTRSSK